ncbi:hypothetical protein VNO78_26950 [Psophocarpus tetragonolobus]|uniref:Uncharacterized protein n=1 Tax=Psophocarpus tetragonolobus TaxID=3891 RepID=A0AAN9S0B2_PSOTE
MVRPPSCNESGVKKGPWTPEEDEKLKSYVSKHGKGTWRTLPKHAGLNRCGKSCRLRWENYLRPDIKRGRFTDEEEQLIFNLHSVLGNKWAKIATHLPRRTDNDIKNHWNTNLRKKLLQMGIDPETHKPRTDFNYLMNLSHLLGMSNLGTSTSPWANPYVNQFAKLQLVQNMLQLINNNSSLVNMGNPNYNLLGNQILNPLDTFLNGTNLQNKDSILTSQEYANPNGINNNSCMLMSQTCSDSSRQNIFKSVTEKESETNQEVLGYNQKISILPENQVNFEYWEKFLIEEDESNGSH